MLDPFSALAIATAVINFIDFGIKSVSSAFKDRTPVQVRSDDLQLTARDMEKRCIALINSMNGDENWDGSEELGSICSECIKIAKEMMAILEKINRQNSRHTLNPERKISNRWSNLRQALEFFWVNEDLTKLEKRLRSYREQMVFHSLVAMRCASRQINASNQGDTQSALIGKRFIENLDEGGQWEADIIAKIDLDDQVLEDYDENGLRGDAGPVFDSTQKVFLRSLSFRGMKDRVHTMPKAYQDTFKWIFEPPDPGHSWSDYTEWLQSPTGSNLYWITGKPGSGKSTLMEYIHNHEKTCRGIQAWVGDSKFISSTFFFWASNKDETQTSKEGLLRSILFQMFSQMPELTPLVCAKRWEVCRLFGLNPRPWVWDELSETVLRIVSRADIRFFITVDGLDEFRGDPKDILVFLDSLCEHRNVKLCVSSRPWPVFEDRYHINPHLRLHHLTEHDISHFIRSQLAHSRGFAELGREDPDFANAFADTIATKSEGVFLWVHIVLRSILQDLQDGVLIAVLKERLEQLPPELEKLFQSMIGGFSGAHTNQAAQLFQIMRCARTSPTLLDLAFALESTTETAVALPVCPLLPDRLLGRCQRMRRRLNSICKGLLEIALPTIYTRDDVTENDMEDELDMIDLNWTADELIDPDTFSDDDQLTAYAIKLSESRVAYMHRTVKDYLEKDEVAAQFSRTLSRDFSAEASLCRSNLMQLKTLPRPIRKGRAWARVVDCMHYASKLDDREALGREVSLTAVLDDLDKTGSILLPHPKPKQQGEKEHKHWTSFATGGVDEYSFLSFAVQYGLSTYVEGKLNHGYPVKQKPRRRSLLDCAILEIHLLTEKLRDVPPVTCQQRFKMVKLLLEHGDDPNRSDGISSDSPWSRLLLRIKDTYEHRPPPRMKSEPFGIRALHHAVALDRARKLSDEEKEHWIDLVEIFLKHKANSWIKVERDTGGALQAYNPQRAAQLQVVLKKRRWSAEQFIIGFKR